MLVCLTVPEQREVVRRGRRRRVQRGAVAQRRHHLQARAERRPRLRRVAPALLQQLVPAHQRLNLRDYIDETSRQPIYNDCVDYVKFLRK